MKVALVLSAFVLTSYSVLFAVDPPASRSRVVAEGVGTTADEAIKDAFRNAIRQVVGAVVDAETLVRDDKVISDKVLTYSDGFIKTYLELSKTNEKGLFRVKISAEVERLSVVSKLKENKVKVIDIDGNGLFSETVTKLEAAKNAKELFAAALKDFQISTISVKVVGKPVIIAKAEDSATVRFDMQVEPEIKTFETVTKKSRDLLEKVAMEKGTLNLAFDTVQLDRNLDYKQYRILNQLGPPATWNDCFQSVAPKMYAQSSKRLLDDRILIAFGTHRNAKADRLEYKWYIVDADLRSVLVQIAKKTLKAKLSLTDSTMKQVTSDTFDLVELLPKAAMPSISGQNLNPKDFPFSEGSLLVAVGPHNDRGLGGLKSEASFYMFSPTFFKCDKDLITHRPQLVISRTLKLTLDELKAVQSAKVILLDE